MKQYLILQKQWYTNMIGLNDIKLELDILFKIIDTILLEIKSYFILNNKYRGSHYR